MRLTDKVAIVAGAGQTPGDTIGNGRATAILFAREGARVMLVDRKADSAGETGRMIKEEGGECFAFEADVTVEEQCRAIARACVDTYGRIDVLQNNVGIGAGDGGITRLSEENWDRIMNVNLKSQFLSCKHVLPIMREQGSGAITNISSVAAVAAGAGMLAYKTSKAGVNALTQALALGNARYGIRVNAIMPGLMDTPMAIEGISAARGISKDELRRQRDAGCPLRGKQGTGWDTAYASLFLASEEAGFITGVVLAVDGGRSAARG